MRMKEDEKNGICKSLNLEFVQFGIDHKKTKKQIHQAYTRLSNIEITFFFIDNISEPMLNWIHTRTDEDTHDPGFIFYSNENLFE